MPSQLTCSADISALARTLPERAHIVLGALTSAVPTARTWARVVLSGWHLEPLADNASVVLTEMVTNSVLHAHGDKADIWLLTDRATLVIMVGDPSPDMPVRADAPADDDLFGRGLVIVDSLAHSWGAYRVATGKVVWALLCP
jgi:anti-sigma regulatory factor (Ser/Thr protein kinase)